MPRWSPNSNSNSSDYIDPRKLGPYNINPNSTNHPNHDQAYINMNARKKSINQMLRMNRGTRISLGDLRRSQINPNVPYGMSPALTHVSRGRTRGTRTPMSPFNWNSESNQSSHLSSIPWDAQSAFEPIDSLASSLSSISMHNSNSDGTRSATSNFNNSGYNSNLNSNSNWNNFSSFGTRSRATSKKSKKSKRSKTRKAKTD